MHELGLLLAKNRSQEIERIARHHAELPPVPRTLRRPLLWRRVR